MPFQRGKTIAELNEALEVDQGCLGRPPSAASRTRPVSASASYSRDPTLMISPDSPGRIGPWGKGG